MVHPGAPLTRLTLAAFALGACYTPPELPHVDEVPIVPSNSCRPDTTVMVSEVLDGDTFRDALSLDDDPSYRLLGVDAPEIAHAPDPADCFGDDAHEALARLIEGKQITLTFDHECEGKFGRTLVYAWLVEEAYLDIASDPTVSEYERSVPGYEGPALMLNEWLIGRGYAQVFPEELFGEILYQDELERAESTAIAGGLGLWSGCASDGTATGRSTTATVAVPGSAGESRGATFLKERG